jgi:hypothetical protein
MICKMQQPKPIIKFNGGNPVALCNRCFCMMCYVRCSPSSDDECMIIEKRGINGLDYTSTEIGKEPPAYCDECINLLNYTLNE